MGDSDSNKKRPISNVDGLIADSDKRQHLPTVDDIIADFNNGNRSKEEVFIILSNSTNINAIYWIAKYYLEESKDQNSVKGIQYLTIAADSGHYSAQEKLASLYNSGKFVPKDDIKTLHYLRMALSGGNDRAQYNYGLLLLYGSSVIERNIQQAIHYLELSAEQNNVFAQEKLMYIYSIGEYVPKDEEKTLHYIKMALKNGGYRAQFNFGLMYLNGSSVIEQNIEQAIRYFELAAGQDYALAHEKLGTMYYYGTHIDKDIVKAFKYLKIAADSGRKVAQYVLALIYLGEYQHIEKNINEGVKYLELSISQNYSLAYERLGLLYQIGTDIPKDDNKAFKLFKIAADAGLHVSQYNMGLIYFFGIGIPKNIEKAIEYYNKSAKQSNKEALVMLGLLYFEGNGVAKNYTEAFKYYKIAADLADSRAENMVGVMHIIGIGAEKNQDEAIKYLDRALRQEYSFAYFNLALINYANKNYEKAYEYFKVRADIKCKTSQFMVGRMLYYGQGVRKNIRNAMGYFKLASDQGIDIFSPIEDIKFMKIRFNVKFPEYNPFDYIRKVRKESKS